MDQMEREDLKSRVFAALRESGEVDATEDGNYFRGEIYADYRDAMEEKTAGKLLDADDPRQAFEELMDSWYGDYEAQLRRDLAKKAGEEVAKDRTRFPNGLSEAEESEIEDIVLEHVYYDYPESHYLNQEFDVNIMIDAGEGNYDYVFNSVYPCWYGHYEERLDSRAGIVWLAKTQGYTKTQLWQALRKGDMRDPHGFLESMRVELANLTSHMSTVTFLVSMTLNRLIELNVALRRLERLTRSNGRLPRGAYLVLGKETIAGLYDPWYGCGSVFEIELERDVRIPLRLVRCIRPDDGGYSHEYSVGNVYGMCGSAWKDSVKAVRIPAKLAEAS